MYSLSNFEGELSRVSTNCSKNFLAAPSSTTPAILRGSGQSLNKQQPTVVGVPMATFRGGGGKLRSAIFRNFPQFRNFSQFSAIYRNFSALPFLRACR